jgi:hypothetical protein
MQTLEQQIEARVSRKIKSDDRMISKIERREVEAEKQIGTLIREGKTISYIMPLGGKYREGCKYDLISFLIRNQYV